MTMGRSGERSSFEGVGETLADALQDAAEHAVAADREANVGREFELVRITVTVDNPRISQHRVVINPTG